VSFHFLKSSLKVYTNIGINQINDPLKKAKDYAKFSGKIVEVSIKDRSEISYVLSLIRQAYERN
jgi:predicted transport protein